MILVRKLGWMDRAACKGEDLSLFVPAAENTITPEAEQACRACPVRQECLDYALTVPLRGGSFAAGVWAETTQRQRTQLRHNAARRARQAGAA